jgi:hypothetical protein
MAHFVAGIEREVVLSRFRLPQRSIANLIISAVMPAFLNMSLPQRRRDYSINKTPFCIADISEFIFSIKKKVLICSLRQVLLWRLN